MKQLGALLTGTAFKKQNRRREYFSLFYPFAFSFLI